MNARILKRFNNIFDDKKTLESYNNLYVALRDWIMNNNNFFSKELKNHMRLNMLIQLNVDDYDLEKIGRKNFPLFYAKERLTERNYKTTDDLLECIDNILWDMVAIEADIECDCIDGDPRYIINQEKENNEILIECNYCAQLYDVNGKKMDRTINKYKPATYLDIQCLTSAKRKDFFCE